MPKKQVTVYCPVGNEPLGYLVGGVDASFVCTDCGFIYRWDENGKALPPEKYIKKKKPEKCSCAGCKERDGEKTIAAPKWALGDDYYG